MEFEPPPDALPVVDDVGAAPELAAVVVVAVGVER